MIERFTIKFGPAVSQKELEKLLTIGGFMKASPPVHKAMMITAAASRRTPIASNRTGTIWLDHG
jgi:hypothetical protein